MSLILTKRSAVFLHVGTVLPIPPSDFVETNKPTIVIPEFSTVQSNRISGDMNSQTEYVDLCRSKASFPIDVNCRATGTALLTAIPEYTNLMYISGFTNSLNPPTDTYEIIPKTNNISKGSAIIYLDDKKFTFTDTLVGGMTANFIVGTEANINFQVSGYIDDVIPVDENNPTVSLSTEKQLIVGCADIITHDGKTIPAESIIITTNPIIENTYTMGGIKGIKADTITDYGLSMDVTFPIDSADYATHATLISDGVPKAIRIVIGADKTSTPVDGESIVILADTSRVVKYVDADKNGILYRTVTYRLENNGTTPALRWLTGKVSGL